MTQAFFKKLIEHREELKESWAAGSFTAAFDVEMAVKNAAATGACSMIQEILNYTSEDLES